MSKLNSRSISVPTSIIITDENGKETNIIKQKDMSIVEYLKLCISLDFVNENDTIPNYKQ